MTSVFDVIAADDSQARVSRRQALALAHKRVNDRFSRFINQRTASAAEHTARLEMIREDFEQVVKTACAEVNHDDHESILRTLWNDNLLRGTSRTASADEGFDKEARRPKLCPYHSEVVDASLAAGKADAGWAAMAQHAWGPKHCQGDEYEGHKCNFKPQMTTQSYWDEKKEKAEQRKQEREQQQVEQENAFEAPKLIDDVDDEGNVELEDSGVNMEGVEPEAQGGEASEPQAGLAQEELMAVAASAGRFAPLEASLKEALLPPVDPRDPRMVGPVQPNPVVPPEQQVPNDVLQQAPQAPSVPPAAVPAGVNVPPNLSPQPGADQTFDPNDPRYQQMLLQQQQQRGAASAPSADKLGPIERTDVTKGGEEAIPKMDTRKWTPQNLQQRIDTEHPNSPHPTRREDIQPDLNEKPKGVTNDGKLQGVGENTTERVDVTKSSPYQGDKAHGTWPSSGPGSAVS